MTEETMSDLSKTRQQNLVFWCAMAALNEATAKYVWNIPSHLGMSDDDFLKLASGKEPISDELARRFERMHSLDDGWLDTNDQRPWERIRPQVNMMHAAFTAADEYEALLGRLSPVA